MKVIEKSINIDFSQQLLFGNIFLGTAFVRLIFKESQSQRIAARNEKTVQWLYDCCRGQSNLVILLSNKHKKKNTLFKYLS